MSAGRQGMAAGNGLLTLPPVPAAVEVVAGVFETQS
jgi:hypothetical protein